MAISKLLVLWIVASFVVVGIRAEAEIDLDVADPVEAVESSAAKAEIQELKSKIGSLESSLSGKIKELKDKDNSIGQLEKTVQEKSESIVSLRSEIELLQKKEAVDVEELVGKAHTRATELEKQVEKLKKDLETQTRSRDAFEAQARETENKVTELNLKIESLQRASDELKWKLQKTERALKVAEEELMRAHLEATSKSKELTEVHGAWLPPWLLAHIVRYQELTATHWKEHGQPAVDVLLQKASEKLAQAQKWVEPHMEVAKTKWIPAVKGQWMTITANVKPHVERASGRTVEVYEICRSTITPHIVKMQEISEPYVQEARKFSKPYIEQIATTTRPHVEKAQVILKPYTNRAVVAYSEFLKSATSYHQQVQDIVQKKLKNYELTRHLATKELVWFVASATLALPILFVYRILSSMFCKKARKPATGAQPNQATRRHKRRHADK